MQGLLQNESEATALFCGKVSSCMVSGEKLLGNLFRKRENGTAKLTFSGDERFDFLHFSVFCAIGSANC